MDSPIKRMGGKKRLSRTIAPMLPSDAECYCEVFAGAAWVLFAKPPHPVEVLNDRDDLLVNLWRVLKWRPAELLEAVHQSLYSRTFFYELRATDPTTLGELERATWLYLMIQQSFGTDLSSVKSAAFGFRNKSRGDLFLNKSLDQFAPAFERLRNVFIENCDFEECVGRYDQPGAIFFCDPPYFGTCGYAEEFRPADHERLARVLGGIEGRFLLTVNDCGETRDLYGRPGWQVREGREPRAISRAASGRQAAPILFVANYRIAPSLWDQEVEYEEMSDRKEEVNA